MYITGNILLVSYIKLLKHRYKIKFLYISNYNIYIFIQM